MPDVCPRCLHYIPSDAEAGSAPGVRTLAPSSTALVCNACAWHETWIQTQGDVVTAQDWPVAVPSRFYGHIGSC